MTISIGAWLLSTAVGAIVLNLFTSYLKDALDRCASALFSKWIGRSERARQEFANRVSELRKNPHSREGVSYTAHALRYYAISMLLFGLVSLCLSILFVLMPVPGSAVLLHRLGDAQSEEHVLLVAHGGAVVTLWAGFFAIMSSLYTHSSAAYLSRVLFAYWKEEAGDLPDQADVPAVDSSVREER
ncbi:hypothetical protein [Paraburkholderia silvatlantica]|uniref:hypothetical protein n=1 Tax=Paraburkholderia silvatlantica TaxID=321895 RepID=UPI0037530624